MTTRAPAVLKINWKEIEKREEKRRGNEFSRVTAGPSCGIQLDFHVPWRPGLFPTVQKVANSTIYFYEYTICSAQSSKCAKCLSKRNYFWQESSRVWSLGSSVWSHIIYYMRFLLYSHISCPGLWSWLVRDPLCHADMPGLNPQI